MKILFTILSLLYALSPYDLVPDIAIGWGWLDDLLILFLLWRFFYSAGGTGRSPGQDPRKFGYSGDSRRQETTGEPDPHAVLGIQRGASAEEIKQAYRTLANRYHPDKVHHLGEEFKVLAERRFKEIDAAYRKLTRK